MLLYLSGSYLDYVNVDSSVHIRKIGQQPIEFCHYVLSGMQQIISQSVLILFAIGGILIFKPAIFLLLILILVPPIFIIAWLIKKKLNSVRVYGKKVSEKALQHLQEALAAFIESNLYGRNNFFTERYHRFQQRFNDHLSEQQVIQNLPSRLIEVFAIFGLFILITINSYFSNESSVQIITLGAFMAAAYKIIPGIVKILNSSGQIRTYSFTIKDLVKNLPNTKSLNEFIQNEEKQCVDNINSVEFKGVTFQYKELRILKALSFSIYKGDMVGISGKSGSGKTTILNLLLGFLDATSGDISINNLIGSQQKFWHRISYVKQQSFFIHDSIDRNITFSNSDINKSRLAEISEITGVDKLIKRYPAEQPVLITENGKNFSGGERQRIQMARALYKEFDLLILDEPFNELDEQSEIEMLLHLQGLAKAGKIIILVTHNTAALAYCNKKIQLDD